MVPAEPRGGQGQDPGVAGRGVAQVVGLAVAGGGERAAGGGTAAAGPSRSQAEAQEAGAGERGGVIVAGRIVEEVRRPANPSVEPGVGNQQGGLVLQRQSAPNIISLKSGGGTGGGQARKKRNRFGKDVISWLGITTQYRRHDYYSYELKTLLSSLCIVFKCLDGLHVDQSRAPGSSLGWATAAAPLCRPRSPSLRSRQR